MSERRFARERDWHWWMARLRPEEQGKRKAPSQAHPHALPLPVVWMMICAAAFLATSGSLRGSAPVPQNNPNGTDDVAPQR